MSDTPHTNPMPDPMAASGGTDPTAARVRAALHAEAAMVHPNDTLTSIRERTEGGQRPWWHHPGVLAVAAAIVLGLLVGGGLTMLGGDEEDSPIVGTDPTESATSAEPTPTESESPSESPTPVPVEGDVYVYYVMDDGRAPRLYREQQPGIGADPAMTGVGLAVAGEATDPDYGSPWPKDTEVLDYAVEGDTATVDLSRFVSAGAEAETAAVQQLVYTVTANDKSVKRVQLLVNGVAPSSGHADWSQPIARAPMVEVQGLVWLLAPTEGATVSSPVDIAGYGTAFEGTISWDVRLEGSDEVVAEGFTQGGANGEFGEFSDTVELEPGTYVMRAFESSAENGEPVHVDTKTFTVG